MTDLVKKARAGRTNALAGLTNVLGGGLPAGDNSIRFRTNFHTGPIPFISKRAQSPASNWIH